MTPEIAIGLVLKYGPAVLTDVEKLFEKTTVTAAEVQAIFAGLKPYAWFGIGPGTPAPTTTTISISTPVAAAPAAT